MMGSEVAMMSDISTDTPDTVGTYGTWQANPYGYVNNIDNITLSYGRKIAGRIHVL